MKTIFIYDVTHNNLTLQHTFIVKNNNVCLEPPFVHLPLLLRLLVAFKFAHTRENQYPLPRYVVYTNASNNTSSYTHVNLYMIERDNASRWCWCE